MQEKKINVEMTSMEASSSSSTTSNPPQEPPSGDSHDEQKTRLNCSMSSPSHFGEFFTSRSSAFTNIGPGTVLPSEAELGDHRIHGNQQPYNEIQEEEVLDDDDDGGINGNQPEPTDGIQEQEEVIDDDDYGRIHGNPQEPNDGNQEEEVLDDDYSSQERLLGYCVTGAFSLMLTLVFYLPLSYAFQSQSPVITVESITFDRFTVSMGSDSSGLQTYMASVNSTVQFTFRNTATFFRFYVTSTPLKLNFLQLTLANGTMEHFYQSKKSQRTVEVVVSGNQIPMCASGASFFNHGGTPVPLNLSFHVISRVHVMGSRLKPVLTYRNMHCSVIFDLKSLKVPLSFDNCT